MHRKQKLLKAMALMDCEDGYECSVRKLPHIDIRHQVQYASDLDATSTQRIFRRDIKAWAHMLLPAVMPRPAFNNPVTFTAGRLDIDGHVHGQRWTV